MWVWKQSCCPHCCLNKPSLDTDRDYSGSRLVIRVSSTKITWKLNKLIFLGLNLFTNIGVQGGTSEPCTFSYTLTCLMVSWIQVLWQSWCGIIVTSSLRVCWLTPRDCIIHVCLCIKKKYCIQEILYQSCLCKIWFASPKFCTINCFIEAKWNDGPCICSSLKNIVFVLKELQQSEMF